MTSIQPGCSWRRIPSNPLLLIRVDRRMSDGTYWVHSVGLCCSRERSKHWLPTEDRLSIHSDIRSCVKLCMCILMLGIHFFNFSVLLVVVMTVLLGVKIFSWNIRSLDQIFTIKVSVDQSPGTWVGLPVCNLGSPYLCC